jgi:excisionase family DNA binding protein
VTVEETPTQALVITVPEAAEMLGVSRGHGYELARKGELPGAIKLGGRTVVSRQVLERTINGETKTR